MSLVSATRTPPGNLEDVPDYPNLPVVYILRGGQLRRQQARLSTRLRQQRTE